MSAALSAGDRAPAFRLFDAGGNVVSLADFVGGRVVLYFFPKAFTPGCTAEACDFRDNFAELEGSGTAVVGISRDVPEVLADFAREHRLGFPLLSDADRTVHAAYGVLGSTQTDGTTKEKVVRSTFVIGPDGLIESARYAVDPNGHVAALMTELLA